MKSLQYLELLICLLLLVGCRTTSSISSSLHATPLPAEGEAIEATLPAFPAEALYVLGARWEADSLLQQEISIADYIEQELLRLYPDRSYQGYVNRLCAVVDGLLIHSRQQPTLFVPKQHEIQLTSKHTNSSSLHSILDSISMEEELQLLELTPQERADWQTLQTIINSEEAITRKTLDTLDMSYFEEENILLTLLLWRGPRLFYRVLQSKARAEKLAKYYYGDATNNGRPGDAFKHIYVNVLLRTYVGEWLSHAIMDIFWEWKSPNAPCDHYMDLHNNVVGRHTRYHDFTTIDTQCSDMRHWLQWGENVQHFIQDSVNGDYQGWDKETPTFIVEPAAKEVSNTQYIYWDK